MDERSRKKSYLNLDAECVRHKVTRLDIANLWNVTESTVIRKLQNGSVTMTEAVLLRNAINPNLTLDYLFSENIDCEG